MHQGIEEMIAPCLLFGLSSTVSKAILLVKKDTGYENRSFINTSRFKSAPYYNVQCVAGCCDLYRIKYRLFLFVSPTSPLPLHFLLFLRYRATAYKKVVSIIVKNNFSKVETFNESAILFFKEVIGGD